MTAFDDIYRVPDLIENRQAVSLVLLLESPYVAEVCHKHPLAGSSGRNVSRFMVRHLEYFRKWSSDIPFGCQLLSRAEPSVALMNCSPYPLDRTAYCAAHYTRHRETVDGWEVIRTNPAAGRRRNRRHRELEEEMVAGLENRLQRLPEAVLIIPCGNMARELLKKCDPGDREVYAPIVPHPSRNLWEGKRNFGDFEGFLAAVRNRAGKEHPG